MSGAARGLPRVACHWLRPLFSTGHEFGLAAAARFEPLGWKRLALTSEVLVVVQLVVAAVRVVAWRLDVGVVAQRNEVSAMMLDAARRPIDVVSVRWWHFLSRDPSA